MKNDKKSDIPRATAKRLSLYYRIFKRFYAGNIEKLVQKKLPKLSESIQLPSAEIFPILESLGVVALATMSKS